MKMNDKEKELAELEKEWRECNKKYYNAKREFDDWLDKLGAIAEYGEHVKKINNALFESKVAYQKLKRAKERTG